MLIKKIILHNIASIADAEIDFYNQILGEASIFLITGETGAGKTTILDAICLALYGKTPRMTSVAKEDIGATDENNDKYYSNDNSQFLRRGTGEGWVKLTFEANDNKEYEAIWTIQRNYKKPDRRLQKPTRALYASDGSYAETNKRIISEKINELTGLDYDQFCRTVMLAQGEFTKFLKSEKSEKSEILEKLTGTEIYSEIGKKIAANFLQIKNKWEDLNRELKNIVILTDEEKNTKIIRIEELIKEAELLEKEKKELEAKINWFNSLKNLVNLKKDTSERVIKLRDILKSDSFIEEESLIHDFKISIEARILVSDKEICNKNIVKREKLFPKLKENLNNCVKEIENKNNDLNEIKTKYDKILRIGEKYDLSKLNEKIHDLNNRQNAINELSSSIDNLEMAKNHYEDLKRDFDLRNNTIFEYKNTIDSLVSPIKTAELRLNEISSDLEKIELASSKGIKSIRETLKKGDLCPVCGAKIEKTLNNDMFSSMLQPLRDRKKEAEKKLLELQVRRNSADKLISEAEKIQKELILKINKQNESIQILNKKRLSKLKECGYENIHDEKLKEKIESEKTGLNNAIQETREKQQEAEKIQKDINNLRKSIDIVKKDLEKATENSFKAKIAMSEWSTDYNNLQSRLKDISDKIHLFLDTNKNISECRLIELSKIKNEYIDEIESNHKKIYENLSKEIGAESNLDEQISKLESKKPDIKEDENVDEYNVAASSITETLNQKQREIGQLKEQLYNDSIALKNYENKIKAEEKARDEKDLWGGLYRLLGDTDGVKFRNVAQSFILRSLLENANVYMKNFTDRYTLTCNPGSLAILVKDCFRPSEPQPASILSGGESFMASLSLALALSNLRSGGNAVDILFIDEGFGTLSQEYLNNVMDTLEKLHQIGGRKVGLISHVPEMKERIPVQIQVHRDSPALSHVSILDLR